MLAVLLAALESDTDRQKFIEIYEKYHVQMERTAMRILKEQSDVEDAVQNAFMQMIRHFEKIFEIPCEELPFWIISIVKNEARAILRKNSRTVSLEDWDGFTEHIDDISGYMELVGVICYFARSKRTFAIIIAGLSCFLYVYNPSGNVWPFNDLFAPDQYWMILSLPFVLVLSDKKEKKEKQMLGHLDYFFYPAHMCLFNVLSTLFS